MVKTHARCGGQQVEGAQARAERPASAGSSCVLIACLRCLFVYRTCLYIVSLCMICLCVYIVVFVFVIRKCMQNENYFAKLLKFIAGYLLKFIDFIKVWILKHLLF